MALAQERQVIVLFEAPHRVRETLSDMLTIFGDRPILVARELTKAHETLVVRPISTLLATLEEPRGEYTLVVPAASGSPAVRPELPTPGDLRVEFGLMTNNGRGGRREAIKQLAQKYQVTTRAMYQLLEEGKNSGN